MFIRLKFLFYFLIASAIFLFLPRNVFAQVVINEFLPNASQEWVEFYNKGDSFVDLGDYYFDDDNTLIVDGQVQTGTSDPGSDPIKLSGVLQISTTCYLDLTTYLNNDGDTPSLFLSNGNTIDSYPYTATQADRSFSRIPDGGDWQANQTPTKSSSKCADLAPTPTPTATSTPTPNPTPTLIPTSPPAPKPTATPTPKSSATTPTSTPTLKLTPTFAPTPVGEILGEEVALSPTMVPSPTATPAAQPSWWNSRNLLPKIFIGAGILLLLGSAIPLVLPKLKKGGILKEDEEID